MEGQASVVLEVTLVDHSGRFVYRIGLTPFRTEQKEG